MNPRDLPDLSKPKFSKSNRRKTKIYIPTFRKKSNKSRRLLASERKSRWRAPGPWRRTCAILRSLPKLLIGMHPAGPPSKMPRMCWRAPGPWLTGLFGPFKGLIRRVRGLLKGLLGGLGPLKNIKVLRDLRGLRGYSFVGFGHCFPIVVYVFTRRNLPIYRQNTPQIHPKHPKG